MPAAVEVLGERRRTVRSHGLKVARSHLLDWVALVLLLVLLFGLVSIPAFRRFVSLELMTDLKYPFKEDTVPVWAVGVVAILAPIVIFVAVYIRRRDVYDLHHAILGIFFSVLITGVITDAIKISVGRPRPNFFWRCFPDGKAVFDSVTGNVICHGVKKVASEGHKSFPSGHASWSFAGLGFLSFYISGKIRAFDRRGHVAKLCIVFLPLIFAALIAASRVSDYWHHWEDVFAGSFIGLAVSTFCYLQFFPPPYHPDGWGPHAYFSYLRDPQNIPSLSVGFVSVPDDDSTSSMSTNNATVVNGMRSNSTLEDVELGDR